MQKLKEEKFWISSICFTEDNKSIVIANGNRIKIKNVATGKTIQNFEESALVNEICISNFALKIYFGHYDGRLKIWENKYLGMGEIMNEDNQLFIEDKKKKIHR